VTVPQYRNSTNFLRGIASLSVLVWHYQHFFYTDWVLITANDNWRQQQPFYWILRVFYENGYLAVQLFWCISGLVLCHAYIAKVETNFKDFFAARFFRLYPLHILTLFVVAALQQLSRSAVQSYQIYQDNDVKNFLLNVGFVQSWVSGRVLSFNAPTWSVSIEIAVYVIFFILLKSLRKTKLIGSISMFTLWTIVTHIYSDLFFGECLSYFLIGVSIWFATKYQSLYKSLFYGLLTSLISCCFLFYLHSVSASALIVVPVFLVALLDKFPHLFDQWFFKRFGELTYSVFLWHTPLQIAIIIFVLRFNIERSVYKSSVFLLAYLASTYFIGNLSFTYIEQPSRKYLTSKFLHRD
jgi:peptidoglycan/LPS O-acetylase OafA/YrhL